MTLVRPLDKYVFVEWMKIFCSTAIGLPILLVIIDLTDHLQTYLTRDIPRAELSVSLRALLLGRIVPRTLELDGARLTLIRAADGRLSLDVGSLAETTEPEPKEGVEPEAEPPSQRPRAQP